MLWMLVLFGVKILARAMYNKIMKLVRGLADDIDDYEDAFRLY